MKTSKQIARSPFSCSKFATEFAEMLQQYYIKNKREDELPKDKDVSLTEEDMQTIIGEVFNSYGLVEGLPLVLLLVLAWNNAFRKSSLESIVWNHLK